MRRFPPPWTTEQITGGCVIKDATGQSRICLCSLLRVTSEHGARDIRFCTKRTWRQQGFLPRSRGWASAISNDLAIWL